MEILTTSWVLTSSNHLKYKLLVKEQPSHSPKEAKNTLWWRLYFLKQYTLSLDVWAHEKPFMSRRLQFCPASITPSFHTALHSLSPCCMQTPCLLLYMLISFYPIIVSRKKVAFLFPLHKQNFRKLRSPEHISKDIMISFLLSLSYTPHPYYLLCLLCSWCNVW